MISRTIHLPNTHSKYKQQISKQEISISKWRTFSHRLLLTMHHPRVINHYIPSKQKKKKNKKKEESKKNPSLQIFMTLFTTPRRHKPSHYRSQHRYIIDTHTHMYLTHSGKISHIGIWNKVETRRSSNVKDIFRSPLTLSSPSNTRALPFSFSFFPLESAAAFFSLFPRRR